MKKLTSALAVAALLGAPAIASAQSEIRPYLLADVSIGYMTDGADYSATQENDYDFMDSNLSSSVYGLRGSHDLGNGLKIIGNLEGDFNTSTGDRHPAGMFRRAANVGIEGSFGRFEFGTKLNPLLAFHNSTYAMGGNSSATVTAVSLGFGNYFTPKAITYTTKIQGLTAQLQYGFEDSRPGSTPFGYAHESVIAGFAKYDFGMFDLGVGAQDVSGSDSAGTDDYTTWTIGAGTNIAGFKIRAAYIDNSDLGDDNKAYRLGASYALSPQLSVGGDFVLHKTDSFLANLQARYAMSKNLMFYGLINHVDNDDDAGSATFAMFHGGNAGGYANRGALAGESETGVAIGAVISF